jgi:hypothetical protein
MASSRADMRERVARSIKWIWLGPVAFVVHDAEEVFVLERWLRRHAEELPSIVSRVFGALTTRQFAVGVAVLALGYALASAHGARALRLGSRPWPYLIVTGAFVGNAITHVLQSALFRGYTPGVVTAVLVSLPYGWLAGRALLEDGVVTRRVEAWCVVAGIVGQLPLALLALSAGRQLGAG